MKYIEGVPHAAVYKPDIRDFSFLLGQSLMKNRTKAYKCVQILTKEDKD